MKTQIKVMEGNPSAVYGYDLSNEKVEAEATGKRHDPLRDPWMRLTRHTIDDAGQVIKRELATYSFEDGHFMVTWREFQHGETLTTRAPLNSYLLWETK